MELLCIIFFKKINKFSLLWEHFISPSLKTLRILHFDLGPAIRNKKISLCWHSVKMFFLLWWRTFSIFSVQGAFFWVLLQCSHCSPFYSALTLKNRRAFQHRIKNPCIVFPPQIVYQLCKSEVELWREGRGFLESLSPDELQAHVCSVPERSWN